MTTYSQDPVCYNVGLKIPNNIPSEGTADFTITPALPAGLKFSPSTGIISGTPLATSPSTTYTVTSNVNSGTVTIKVGNVNLAAIRKQSSYNNKQKCIQQQAKGVCTPINCSDTLSFVQKFKAFTDPSIRDGEYELSANSMMEFVIAASTADVQALIDSYVGGGKYLVSDSSGPPFSLPAGQTALIISVLKDVAEEYYPTATKYAYNQIMEINMFALRLSDSNIVILNLGSYHASPTLINSFYGASVGETATVATLTDSFSKGAGIRVFSSSFESAGFSVSSPSQPNIDFTVTFTPSVVSTDPSSADPVSGLVDASLPGDVISIQTGTEIPIYVGQQHHPTLLVVGGNLTSMSINGVSIVSGGSHVLADTTVSTTITVSGVDIDLYRVAFFSQYRNGYHRIGKLQ